MDCRFAFLCKDAALREDQSLDAIGIGIERVRAAELPVDIPLTFVAGIGYATYEAGLRSLVLGCVDADGHPVFSPTADSREFPDPQGFRNETFTFLLKAPAPGVTFKKYGPYSFYLTVDGHEIAQVSLELAQAEEP